MASAAPDPADWSRQYWLDVPRPIQPRAPHERVQARAPRRTDDPLAARQMELRMAAPALTPSRNEAGLVNASSAPSFPASSLAAGPTGTVPSDRQSKTAPAPAARPVAGAHAAFDADPAPAPVIAVVAADLAAAIRPSEPGRPCFVTWLRDQHKKGGMIGELAKAARLDSLFPKSGDADAVRAHFNRAGADGDAFEALEDAERAYDRLG